MGGEKRRDFPPQTLIGFFWVVMSELPPLPRLPVGVPHFCDWLLGLFCLLHREGGGEWWAEPSSGAESGERDVPPQMATDPEIAGV